MKLYVFQHAPTGERALIKIEKLPPPSLSFSFEDLQQFGACPLVRDQMTRAGNPLSASQHKVSGESESCAHFYNIASLQLLPQPPPPPLTPTTTTARLTGHKAAPLGLLSAFLVSCGCHKMQPTTSQRHIKAWFTLPLPNVLKLFNSSSHEDTLW